MRIDITVCYTIIEKCFEALNYFEPNNIGGKILEEFHRRRINLSEQLEKKQLEYFEKNKPQLLDLYQQFIESIIIYDEHVNLIDIDNINSDLGDMIEDPYLLELCNICLNTNDKVLLSEYTDELICTMPLGITILNKDDILDIRKDNLLNNYRLPIIRKRIKKGMPSMELSEWLSRFLITETDIKIIDGYIYQERYNFLQYFLSHIPKGANIKIYTLEDLTQGYKASLIKNTFTNGVYKMWNIEVYIIPNKKEQHARNIFTNKYYIEIDKGMRCFGRKGVTDQTDIDVEYVTKIFDDTMPLSVRAM